MDSDKYYTDLLEKQSKELIAKLSNEREEALECADGILRYILSHHFEPRPDFKIGHSLMEVLLQISNAVTKWKVDLMPINSKEEEFTAALAREAKLLIAVLHLENWFIENTDGHHHCPWCYGRGDDAHGEELVWAHIVHHSSVDGIPCPIGAALSATSADALKFDSSGVESGHALNRGGVSARPDDLGEAHGNKINPIAGGSVPPAVICEKCHGRGVIFRLGDIGYDICDRCAALSATTEEKKP